MVESSQMIVMAKDMQRAIKRHEELGLNLDEETFYDALVLTQAEALADV